MKRLKAGGTSLAALVLAMAGGLAVVGCGGDDSGTGPTGDDGGTDALTDGASTDGTAHDGAVDAHADTGVDSAADSAADGSTDGSTEASSDGGGPVASFSTSDIALGAGNCGGAAVTQTFDVMNSGTAALTIGASVTGTVFTVTPAALSVAPGATGTLTITATVPQASTAGTDLSSSLALTTNDPAHATASIGLSVTPTGATLAWGASSPTAASFGTQPENHAATPIALTLDNIGNATASVSFAAPGGMFTLSPTTAGIAAGSNQILSAGFTPTNLVAQQASSAFTVAGAVCGTSVSALAFTGQGATGSVTGWPTAAFDFGANACGGTAAAAQMFTLTNSGAVAAHISTVTFGGYAGYVSSAAAGATIPANGSLVVTITPPSIPFPSAVPGNYAGTVTFTTDVVGDTTHQVAVNEAAKGAILAFDTTGTPGFGNFGQVPSGTTASENFTVDNNGTDTSSVTLSTTTPFGVTTAVFNLSGNSTQTDSATFSPTSFGAFNANLSISGSNLCQVAPTPISLSGTGEAGGISITNSPTPFAVNCGSTATPQVMTITNAGNQAMTWTGVLSSTDSATGTWYTISPSTATLAAGTSSMVTVTPVAMPQYPAGPTNVVQFNDTIVITTDILGDTPHNIALSETPLGDILSFDTTSFTFGPSPINTPETASFGIINGANAGTPQASVAIASNAPGSAQFSVSPATALVNAGAESGNIGVTFQASAPGSYNGDIGIATTDVLCAALPADLTPSAQATEAGPACNSTGSGPCALTFGDVNCGSQATSAQLFMTNSGTQAYTVTGLALTTNTYYTVAMTPASGVVNPGGQVAITVTPKAIPGTVPSVPDSPTYSDTLTITTNANSPQNTFHAALAMGAAGVIIDNNLASTNWSFGTVNYGSTGTYNVAIHNSGNQAVEVSLAGLSYPNIFGLQSNPTVEATEPATFTVTGTFQPPAGNGTWADSGTLTVVPVGGGVLCQPLPSSWSSPNVTFTGSASNNPIVTIAGSLSFPQVTCQGALPTAQTVTIYNNGSSAQAYTAQLSLGTYYTVAPPSGTIPGSGTAQVTVTPILSTYGAGVNPGSSPYSDSLVVTVAGNQFNAPVSLTLNGMVLTMASYNGTAYDYIEDGPGTPCNQAFLEDGSFSLLNTGNVAGAVNVMASSNDWSVTSSSGTLQPTAEYSTNIQWNGGQTGTDICTTGTYAQGTLSFTGSNLCQPLTEPVYGGYYDVSYYDCCGNGQCCCGGSCL